MIGYIWLFEAISWFHSVIWAISTMEYIDYFGLNHVFKYFVTGGKSSEVDSCFALWQLNQLFGYQFFQVMSLGMNIWLWIDLILTLQKPFYPAKRRFKFYIMFSLGLAAIMTLISIEGAKETCLTPTSAASSTLQNVSLTFLLSIYILVSVFSIIYAARMLYRPGMSPELRQIFMKKHLLYAISFIFIWSVQLLNAYAQLYSADESDQEVQLILQSGYTRRTIRSPFGLYMTVWVIPGQDNYMQLSPLEVISFISSISSGLFMGIIRFTEPYFLFLLKKEFFECFGIPYTEEEINKGDSKLTDTISAFLNSSLNIELVHIILKAISQEWTKEDKYLNMNFDYKDRTVYDEQKIHEIKEIIIDDPKKWKLVDATVAQNKRFNFNVLDNKQEEDGALIINENITVTELAPRIFNAIRREEGIDNEMIRQSLSPENNRDSVFKAGEGQGKSGSFFFFSHDRKFLIKTMNGEEYKTFQNLFKQYYSHLMKNKNSLLARIYGIYTVKKEKIEPVRLILMGNTVNTEGKGEFLKYMFDLKGSFANRKVKMAKNHKPSSTLKDINLIEIK